jgi:RHS repeat-associated protein
MYDKALEHINIAIQDALLSKRNNDIYEYYQLRFEVNQIINKENAIEDIDKMIEIEPSQYDWDFLFTSRRLDKETGLMYYRNRYYRPVMGCFTTVDSLGDNADNVNLYRYVNNQP